MKPEAVYIDYIRVIIAGNRNFKDYEKLKRACDKLLKNHPNAQIVSGMASGADTLGIQYARERGLKKHEFPAHWDDIQGKPAHEIGTRRDGTKYWKLAGFARNQTMAEFADALIAFHNGSSGTADMIKRAKKQGLQIRVIKI